MWETKKHYRYQFSQWVDRIDSLIETMVILLLVFAPLAFGVVHAWSEEIVLVFAAVLSMLFVLKLMLQPSSRFVWSWSYVPLGLFVLLVLFQLMPLSANTMSRLSPNTVELKQYLLGDTSETGSLPTDMSISFYGHATWHALRMVFAVVSLFVVILNVYRTPRQVKRLLIAVALIGGAVAILAIIQFMLDNGKIYWCIATPRDLCFGPFVNHSHYAQFMNMSIGAALALLFIELYEGIGDQRLSVEVINEFYESRQTCWVWIFLGLIVLGITTICLSLARGGMISMLIAGVFTTLVISAKKSLKGRCKVMTIMALGAFVCVLYFGFDAVYDRLLTLGYIQNAEGGRWQILKDVAVAWRQFPVFGTGLGTHAVVYPLFDRSTSSYLAAHAENEYAQIAEETGLFGLVVALVVIVMIWWAFARSLRKQSGSIVLATYGLGFGLLAVMIHSLSDFGQHLPANAILFAVFCAILFNLASLGDRQGEGRTGVVIPVWKRPLCLGILAGLSVLWLMGLRQADLARRAESFWKQVTTLDTVFREREWQGSNAEYIDLLSAASAASDFQPGNVHYRHWLNVYRWFSVSHVKDPNTGETLLSPESVEFARRIVQELHQTRRLCPTFGATYCVAGQIETWVLNNPEGARHIRLGRRLAPHDATVCFTTGLLEAHEGKGQEALAQMSRAVKLDSDFFNEAVDMCINLLNRPDYALQLAEGNLNRLNYLAFVLGECDEHEAIVADVHNQVRSLLEKSCQQSDAPAFVHASLARIYARQDSNQEAIIHYRRALALDYGQVDWRCNLAQSLANTGAISDAIREAKICLRLQPQYAPAEQLIQELSLRVDGL